MWANHSDKLNKLILKAPHLWHPQSLPQKHTYTHFNIKTGQQQPQQPVFAEKEMVKLPETV